MQKVSYTLPPPPVHVCDRAARFLKLLPIAALLAAGFAPQAWAVDYGGEEKCTSTACSYTGKGATNNGVYVDSTKYTYAYGAYPNAGGSVSNNTLTIASTGEVKKRAAGGWTNTSGDAEWNKLIIQGTVGVVAYGGYACGSANHNTVEIDGGAVTSNGDVYGGLAERYGTCEGDATYNTVTISNGTVDGDVIGGSGTLTVSNNTVTLKDSTVGGLVVGGGTDSTVTLAGSTEVGDTVRGGNSSRNTLNVQAKGLPVGGVDNFDTINFTLPNDIAKDDVVLSVGKDNATFADSTEVSITVTGAPGLKKDETFKLIAVTGAGKTLTLTPKDSVISAGAYKFKLENDGKNLIATVMEAPAAPPHNVNMPASFANGSVDCGGNQVADGGTLQCTATPDDGYALDSLTLTSGTRIETCPTATTTSPCELSGVTEDVSVSATFRLLPTITVAATTNGTVTCNGNSGTVTAEGTLTCDASPNTGFVLGSMELSVGGSVIKTCTTSPCTQDGITDDVSVTATFVPLPSYTVTPIASPAAGGTFTCTSPVFSGSDTECTAVANEGYTFTGMAVTSGTENIVRCDPSGAGYMCIYTVTDDMEVTATFTKTGGTGTDPGTGGGGGTDPGTGGGTGGNTPGGDTPGGNAPGAGGGGDSSSPTTGELGLLLSGLALAGAAALALRRREKQGKKADTRQ